MDTNGSQPTCHFCGKTDDTLRELFDNRYGGVIADLEGEIQMLAHDHGIDAPIDPENPIDTSSLGAGTRTFGQILTDGSAILDELKRMQGPSKVESLETTRMTVPDPARILKDIDVVQTPELMKTAAVLESFVEERDTFRLAEVDDPDSGQILVCPICQETH